MKKYLFHRFLMTWFIITCVAIHPMISQVAFDFSIGNSIALHEPIEPTQTSTTINSYNFGISYVPKKFGFGLQASTSSIKSNDIYLRQFNNLDVSFVGDNIKWENKFFFLGPVLKLGGNKFNLEFFPKIGIGQISSPDRQYSFQQGQEQILLYKDNFDTATPNSTELFSGLDAKVNIGITKNISTNVFAGVNSNRFFGSGTSTIYRESPDNVGSIEEVLSGRLLQADCDYYELFTVGVGLTIAFPGRKKEDSKDAIVQPPVNLYPEHDGKLSIVQADSIRFEWNPEWQELKGTNYVLTVFKMEDNKEDLVFTKKINKEKFFDHTDEPALELGKYKWNIQAVDANGITRCKKGCYSHETEFEVRGMFVPQFYHLVPRNIGNYVPIDNKIRFVVESSLLNTDKLSAKIYDNQNAVVMSIDDILKDKKQIKRLTSGRFELDIAGLERESYYVMKVYNAERSYFFRFHTHKIRTNDYEK